MPCVLLLLIYSKYLHTLCFDDIVELQVRAQEMFRFFVIFQVPACPTILSNSAGQGGVLYGAGRPSLTSIPYILLLLLCSTYLHRIYFPFFMCFTSLFFSFVVVFHVYIYKISFRFYSAHAIFRCARTSCTTFGCSVRPCALKIWITYIQVYMPYESSEDSSKQSYGPTGSSRCPLDPLGPPATPN